MTFPSCLSLVNVVDFFSNFSLFARQSFAMACSLALWVLLIVACTSRPLASFLSNSVVLILRSVLQLLASFVITSALVGGVSLEVSSLSVCSVCPSILHQNFAACPEVALQSLHLVHRHMVEQCIPCL